MTMECDACHHLIYLSEYSADTIVIPPDDKRCPKCNELMLGKEERLLK